MSCLNKGPGPYPKPSLTGYNNHDATKTRWPAYSIGIKPSGRGVQLTPGPYQTGRLTQHGAHPYVGYTIGIRPPPRPIAQTAGPADYFYQEKPKSGYTMAHKYGDKTGGRSPGPADYFYNPDRRGQMSMAGKYPTRNINLTPGPYPAVDLHVYKNKAPAVPMIGNRGGQHPSVGPGPNAFFPGRPDNPPAYTFGLKHHPCAPPMIVPADNNY